MITFLRTLAFTCLFLISISSRAQITFSKLTSHVLSSMTTTIENNTNGAGAWITGDFDGDGDLDIVGRVAADNALAYWRNDGVTWTSLTGSNNPFNGITFTAAVLSFNNNNAAALDIDGDGDIDIYNGGVNEVYRNNGNGTFTKLTSHPLSALTTTIENNTNGAGAWITGDFDGDGDLDIVGRVASDDALAYWRNDGTTWTSLTGSNNPFNGITFTAGVTSFNNNNAAALDIDGDGDIDIFNSGVNEVYRNNGNGTFTKLTSHPLSAMTTTIENNTNGAGAWITGDFDGDGDLDIVGRVASDDALAYWRNDGGTWTSLTGSLNPFNAISFTAGTTSFNWNNATAIDIDNDGDFDIFNSGVNEVYLASGSAPVVTNTTPAHLGTAVASTNITLFFNESITTGSGNIYIRRLSDNVAVQTFAANSVNVSGSGTSTITINPPVDLTQSVTYYVTFDKNVFFDADGIIVGRVSTMAKLRVPFNNSAFLQFTISGTLPVNMLNFTAIAVNGKAQLRWQTSSEQQTKDFTIQYSNDGNIWNNIGKVIAAGQSTTVTSYTFNDPLNLRAINYYRLVLADENGRETISAVRMVRAATSSISLYPNPVTGKLNVQLPTSGAAELFIYNSGGQLMLHSTSRTNNLSLNLDGWTKGMYQIVINQDQQQFIERFLIH